MAQFVLAYLARHLHALCQYFEQLIVEGVYARAHFTQTLGLQGLVANDQLVPYLVKTLWRYLLRGIAPSLVGAAMSLYYQAVEAYVERLLRQRIYQLTLATYVAGVADYGKVRIAYAQFQRYAPAGLLR